MHSIQPSRIMFATYQLLGTDSECNDERNDLYASEIDTYDIKF
jgi:hypothetical protein